MRVVQGDAAAIYLERQLGIHISTPRHAVGFETDEGKMLAAFAFSNFNGSNIDITLAGRMSHRILRAVAVYVFDQLKCRRVTATIKRSNKRALKAAYRFGFTYEHVLKRYFPDGDAVLFRLFREDCRWLNESD